jgi:hypothetical protein
MYQTLGQLKLLLQHQASRFHASVVANAEPCQKQTTRQPNTAHTHLQWKDAPHAGAVEVLLHHQARHFRAG